MATAKAKLRFYRQSPRKVRQVVNILRGLDVTAAEAQLEVLPKRASRALLKLLNSAVANALNGEESKEKISKDQLYISEIRVDQGPVYKRYMPKAHGRATTIRKRTSHISLVLDVRGDDKKSAVKVEQLEKQPGLEKTLTRSKKPVKPAKKDKAKTKQ
jgi:large subunit ribosomal protein L22